MTAATSRESSCSWMGASPKCRRGRKTMPLAKIHVLQGRYDEARPDRVSNAGQHGLISAPGIPPDHLFQIIHVLPPAQVRHTRAVPRLTHSGDLNLLGS